MNGKEEPVSNIAPHPDRVPDVVFKTRVRDEAMAGPNPYRWRERKSGEIFGGRKVVLFALPGAFTPTCSSTHLPGFEAHYDEFVQLGIDEVICLSVNDAFVMFQWGKALGIENVTLLPDGSARFSRAMGMLVAKDNLGFGQRSWRYSMFADDGKIVKLLAEPGFGDDVEDDPLEVSDAETMLAFLRSHLAIADSDLDPTSERLRA